MSQVIGDRAGEAAAFFQLGILARHLDRVEAGARLIAICWMITKGIGHGTAESAYRTLVDFCTQAGLDSKPFERLLGDVAASYKADRGRLLVERAFAQCTGDTVESD